MTIKVPSTLADELESWSDIQHDDAAIVACGERWKAVAALIGCTLHGYNDGFTASFTTPDGNVIEVGPKFRHRIASQTASPTGDYGELIEKARWNAAHYAGPIADEWQAAADALSELQGRVERMGAENADLRDSVIAFGAPWAVDYAKSFGLAPGELHPTHYDLLANAGARMDDFKRAALTPEPSHDQ